MRLAAKHGVVSMAQLACATKRQLMRHLATTFKNKGVRPARHFLNRAACVTTRRNRESLRAQLDRLILRQSLRQVWSHMTKYPEHPHLGVCAAIAAAEKVTPKRHSDIIIKRINKRLEFEERAERESRSEYRFMY